ncbi:MAG: peptidoglycan DD-metalloendopeptidase family protein [Leptospirillia bacterium]
MSQTEKTSAFPFRRVFGFLIFAAFGFWVWSGLFVHVRDVEATLASPVFRMAAEPINLTVVPGQTVRGEIRPGQSMFGVLSRFGLDKQQITQIVRTAKPVKDLNRVKRGQVYRVMLDREGAFRTFELDISGTRMLRVSTTPFGFEAGDEAITFEKRLRLLSGQAQHTMFPDLMKLKGGGALIRSLYDVFAWQIDFNRDIRRGDDYRLLVEEIWRDGSFDRFGDIQYVQIRNQGKPYEAIRFDGEYYDPDGHALRGTLLPTPVDYTRISSRFSNGRRHPITGRVQPHHGVDLVAPYGAPVYAAGDGVVVHVGRKGENGRLVTIRHKGAYRTAYAHLSRYGKGIRPGVRVRQGDVIGHVGNSGRSTGTHLHYAVYLNGRPKDPLKLDYTPVTLPIDLASRQDFQVIWDEARLNLVRMEGGERAVTVALR